MEGTGASIRRRKWRWIGHRKKTFTLAEITPPEQLEATTTTTKEHTSGGLTRLCHKVNMKSLARKGSRHMIRTRKHETKA